MAGGRSSRRCAGRFGGWLLALTAVPVLLTSPAAAFEAADGRLQAHGYFESQLRALNTDFSEDWDVSQWYMIFNLEVELDLVQDTIGPIDLMSAYVRAEVRYDCIYSNGCGMFRSMNTYGDRSKSLPRRLNDQDRIRHAGRIRILNNPDLPDQVREFQPNRGTNTDPLTALNDPVLALFASGGGGDGFTPREPCDLGTLCTYLAGGSAVQTLWPDLDTPYIGISEAGGFEDFAFAAPKNQAGAGPWLPKNRFQSNGTGRTYSNPFDNRAASYAVQSAVYNSYLVATNDYQPLFDAAGNPIDDPSSPTPDLMMIGAGAARLAAVIAAATNGEDTNGNGILDTEDLDGDTNLDVFEDLNGNMILDTEDVNGNGILDPGEDVNNNMVLDTEDQDLDGTLDLVAEDVNNNGFLDRGEDLNGNGALDVVGGLTASNGGDLPYRPAPLRREDGVGVGQAIAAGEARGLFIPTAPTARLLDSGDLTAIESDYNLTENQRAWNRGASQKDEKELKEAYLDIETLDNRLWLRVGKQQIVWGKTELFRTTDQFNPTDAALASLPSLEESRIALWSLRAVWSFYEVGIFDDVRIEAAFNFDDYQQIDIGACGEPYAPNLVCGLSFGSFVHGPLGIGLVGVEKPPSPWQSLKGWEVGARLEWRYDRFSFALMDWYGYDDAPTIEQVSTYTRNVDPTSGRPREIFANLETFNPGGLVEQLGKQGPCISGLESACLNGLNLLDTDGPGVGGGGNGVGFAEADFDLDGTIDGIPYALVLDPNNPVTNAVVSGNGAFVQNPYEDANGNEILDPGEDLDGDGVLDLGAESEALTNAAVAQQVFAFTCATTIGFTALDRSSCALNLFGSSGLVPGSPLPITLGQSIGLILAGNPTLSQFLQGVPSNQAQEVTGFGGFTLPLVGLEQDTSTDQRNERTNGELGDCLDRNPNSAIGNFFPCGGRGSSLTATGLGDSLTPEQEALLGCGPFWGTQCDSSGIDLLNAEGSALFQSWPGVEGTVQNGDITTPWLTNQRVTLIDETTSTPFEAFADQPGTRGWFVRRGDGLYGTRVTQASTGFTADNRAHQVGPVCSTANFGGAIFRNSDVALENDHANGNQAVLPGCRRKWKEDPGDVLGGTTPAQLEFLNLYGQDLTCARERLNNGGATVTPGCNGLGDFDSPRVDPRSWELARDGNPDNLGIIADTGQVTITPPARSIDGVAPALVIPDFFYTPRGLAPAAGTSNGACQAVFSCTTYEFANNAFNPNAVARFFGRGFDSCGGTVPGVPSGGIPAAVSNAFGGEEFVPCGRGGHPMTGQPWASEMAAISWNFMVLVVETELQPIFDEAILDPANAMRTPTDIAREIWFDANNCSIVQPALCDGFRTLMGAIGLQRNIRRAGGNGVHGRRTFVWQSGGEAILTYEKRNVLGFSMDFAEDVTKSNFSMEFTWIEGIPVADNLEYDGLDEADDFNLTMSVDRPTFINFLNSNRTFFFNWQFFMRYRDGWEKGFSDEGAWSFLTTFAVATGYFQDRLTPSVVGVWDIRTQSGALLAGIGYRITENFSASIGMAHFFGKPDQTDEPLEGLGPAGNRSGQALDDIYKSRRNGGLSIISEKDELFARVRYTF